MSEFISKSDFDDAFEEALNRKVENTYFNGENIPIVENRENTDWMFDEFPEDLSTWERCVKRFEEVSNQSKMWDSLRHALKHGRWPDARTIESVLIAMDNIEHENFHESVRVD